MAWERTLLLDPLSEDIERRNKIIEILEHETDFATRADLAEELVRECSLVEDTKEQALYPVLRAAGLDAVVERMCSSSEAVRQAMDPIYAAVHNTVPIDVHFDDPASFGRALDHLCAVVRVAIDQETRELDEANRKLTRDERCSLAEELQRARQGALERPRPTKGRALRIFSRMLDKINRPDSADQHRPGRERLSD